MGENLHPAIPILMMIGGMALAIYAAYLHYVALPSEQAPRHVATRAVLVVVGIALILLATGLLD